MTLKEHQTELIRELSAHGVTAEREHLPELLNTGIDTFLERRNIHLPEKQLTTLRLITHCMRDHEGSIRV